MGLRARLALLDLRTFLQKVDEIGELKTIRGAVRTWRLEQSPRSRCSTTGRRCCSTTFAGGRPPLLDARWARASLETLTAIAQSAAEHKKVYLSKRVPAPYPKAAAAA